MWSIVDVAVFIWLLGLSIGDWKKQELPIWQLGPMGIGIVIYVVWNHYGTQDMWAHVFGGLLGCVFLLVSRCSREKLGYGDSVVLLILGIYLGIWEFMKVGVVAFVLCFLVGLAYLLSQRGVRKVGMDSEQLDIKERGIAFLPFLLVAYTLGVMLT